MNVGIHWKHTSRESSSQLEYCEQEVYVASEQFDIKILHIVMHRIRISIQKKRSIMASVIEMLSSLDDLMMKLRDSV